MNKKRKKTEIPPETITLPEEVSQKEKDKLIENRLYDTLNAVELKKSMDKWLKTNEEYLNSFILLGYTMEDERVIIQSYGTPKDKDALMEFLKNVFIQQCHQNNQEE